MDIQHVAHLARIELSPEELAEFAPQLDAVLQFVEKLNTLDVTGVDPTAHANAVVNVFREDAVRPSLPKTEALSNAPHQANGLFMVTKVVE